MHQNKMKDSRCETAAMNDKLAYEQRLGQALSQAQCGILGTGGLCAPPDGLRDVAKRLNVLDDLGQELHSRLGFLYDRLDPAMTSPMDAADCCTAQSPVTTRLGDRLDIIERTLRNAIERVSDMERRIQL